MDKNNNSQTQTQTIKATDLAALMGIDVVQIDAYGQVLVRK